MRTKLKRLFLSGFRSFVDDTVIDFDDTGLWLLQGVSGSGKSSIFVAIAYALGYSPYPATELASWGGEAAMKVELTLDTPQGEVRVKRTPQLSLHVAGEQVKGGAKACEERLQSILGASPDILALLTYRQQRTPGLFLSQTDAEKKDLLTALLNLDRFERAIDTSQAAIKDLEGKFQIAQGRLEAVNTSLANVADNPDPQVLREQIAELGKGILATCRRVEHFKAKIAACKEQRQQEVQTAFDSFGPAIAFAKDTLSGILKPAVEFDDTETNRLNSLVTSATGRIATLTKEDSERQKTEGAKRTALQQKVLVFRKAASQSTGLKRDQDRLLKELESITDDNCPTCERPWELAGTHKGHIKAKIQENVLALCECAEAEEKEKETQLELTFLPDFVPNPLIDKLKEAKTKAEEQLRGEQGRKKALEATAEAEYRQKRAEAQSALAQLQAEQLGARQEAAKLPFPELEEAELALGEEGRIESASRTHLALMKQQLSHANQATAALEARKRELATAQATVSSLETQLAAEKDWLGAIDRNGFLGLVFQECLEEIADEVNTILGGIANTQRVTLAFKSESTTQKGTVKRSIVPVVSVGGNEVTSIRSALSGGMMSTLELVTDLSLASVISRRSGIVPGWLILDEAMDGLDENSKESAMSILEQFSRDRLVLICDHSSEFKSLFQRTLTISCSEGKSTIV